jgi:phage/plasmid-associated DNA primase
LTGYAVQPDRRIASVVIARGEGNNGKTALIGTLVRLVGRDLVAAMPVQDLDKSRFTIGSLLGKLIFVDDDVKTGTRLPDGQMNPHSPDAHVSE